MLKLELICSYIFSLLRLKPMHHLLLYMLMPRSF